MANNEVLELEAKIKIDSEEFEAKLKNIGVKANSMATSLSGSMTNKIGNAFNSIGDALTKAGNTLSNWGKTASVVTAGVTAVLGASFVKAKSFIGTYESAMTVFTRKLEGGEQAALNMYNELVRIAKGSAYAQEYMVSAGQTLVAMGVDANTTSKYVQAATDAISGFGGSGAEVEAMAERFGKISQQTNIYTQDLNTMAAVGIPAWDILATKYNVTKEKVKEMAKDGLLPATQSLNTIADALETTDKKSKYFQYSVAGLAQELKSGTLTGVLDSLNTSFRTFSLELLDLDPRTESGKENIKKLNTALSNFGKLMETVGSRFSNVGKSIGNWLTKISTGIADFTNRLSKLPQKKIDQIVKAVGIVAAAGPGLTIAGKALKTFGLSFKTLGGLLNGVSSGLSAIFGSISGIGTVASAVATGGIALLVASFVTLYATNENFRKSCNEIFQSISNSVSNLWGTVSPIFNGLKDILYGVGTVLSTLVLSGFQVIGEAISTVTNLLMPLSSAFQSVGNWLSDFGKSLQGIFDPLVDGTVRASENISEATASAINDYQQLETDATSSLNNLKWSSSAISEDTKNEIINKYKTMKDKIVEILNEQKNATLNSVKEAFNDTATITQEEQTKTLEALEKHYEDEKISVEDGERRISEIMTNAAKENRQITDEEYQEITSIRDKMNATVTEALSQSKIEQLAIIEDLKNKSGEITAEQAGDAVKKSLDQKTKVVEAAQQEYDERLKTAAKIKQDLGDEYAEIADKIIEEADRQYQSTLRTAQDQHYGVVSEAKKQAGDHVDAINWETGQAKTLWDKMKDATHETFSKMTGGMTDTWDEALNKLVDSGNLTKTQLDNISAEQEQELLDHWSQTDLNAKSKWEDIKRKIVENAENAKTDADKSGEKLEDNMSEHYKEIADQAKTQMEDANKYISSGVSDMESKTSGAKWNWPKMKMPHIKTNGSFSLNPLSIPSFWVEWYKKGAVLNKPTAFGINPSSGNIMAGGEAGAEAVAPIDVLQDYVSTAVNNSNGQVADVLGAIVDLLSQYLPTISNRKMVLDTGAMVGELSPYFDERLGTISMLKERGN